MEFYVGSAQEIYVAKRYVQRSCCSTMTSWLFYLMVGPHYSLQNALDLFLDQFELS